MNLKTVIATLVFLALGSNPGTAGALCLDPKTFISGYTEPLESEVRTAEAIVVGRVISERGLKEDPDDPNGVTAYNVAIRVSAHLKGNLPDVIVVRNENMSSRYPMSVGEEHVLFVSRSGQELWVNSCGNSGELPKKNSSGSANPNGIRKIEPGHKQQVMISEHPHASIFRPAHGLSGAECSC